MWEPTFFREFGSLLMAHAQTQNNTLLNRLAHQTKKIRLNDLFSIVKDTMGLGLIVPGFASVILLPRFLGRINRDKDAS